MPPTGPDPSAAARFVWESARLVDRLRFAHIFSGGDRAPVLAALRAYQNADGGFGHALEPDLRTPASQPAAVRSALEMLDQVGGMDDPMVSAACDYLQTITTSDGGLPFVLPSAQGWPRAPWWQAEGEPAASIVFTGPIAGLLHKHGIAHPWLERATDYSWRAVRGFAVPDSLPAGWTIARVAKGYEARAALAFLEHAPERGLAEASRTRIAALVLREGLVALDPAEKGEAHTPLDYAPAPDSPMRPFFPEATIAAHLDAMSAAQQADGGWMFRWQAWSPGPTLEWRGWLTVETLRVLRAYGRVLESGEGLAPLP